MDSLVSLIVPRSVWIALVLLAAGAALLAWPLVKRRQARRDASRPPRPPTLEARVVALHAAAKERDEIARLIDEAREVIRLGCAQLDARLERMQRLPQAAPICQDRAASPALLPNVHARSAKPAAAPESREDDADPLAKEIYALADAGHSPVDIASRLQEHTGKVELMLALRRV
jgi:hypothetical protein